MLLFDIVDLILNVETCDDLFQRCPASAFKAVAAAFATQGYWVQADILDLLTFTQFGLWAPLVYILAAGGGLVAVALGQPPRTYMWFFIGPAIYAWLIDTRTPVTGVEWRTGARHPQDMKEVWKLAEPGLVNTNQAKKMRTVGFLTITGDEGPDENIRVSNAFLWFDELISSTIQHMIDWVGPHSMVTSNADGGKTFLPDAGDAGWSEDRTDWLLLTDAKWGILEDVTQATIHDNALRDVFIDFMAGECGDIFADHIDNTHFLRAAQAEGANIPRTIFPLKAGAPNYDALIQGLRSQVVPMPYNLKKLLQGGGLTFGNVGSFANSMDFQGAGIIDWVNNHDAIRCDSLLDLIISAFRWESGHAHQSMLQTAPEGMTQEQIVYSLFYGWDFGEGGATGTNIDICNQVRFLQNLVLVHLIRNEMEIAPQFINERDTSSDRVINYAQSYQRTTGSKNKFGELYTWALMVPYIQGVLLYILAIGYPFACILMLIPGWHKILMTWASFWLWVKLWDLGFAVVVSVERTIWAMMGNSFTSESLHQRILEMEAFGQVEAICFDASLAAKATCDNANALFACTPGCPVCTEGEAPWIDLYSGATGLSGQPDQTTFLENLQIFDRSLAVGANLDYDLSNGYYIFIMAALYFAVPAVTGQMVLGAKAGAAGLVNTAISGVSSEAGRNAGSGYVADLTQRAKAASNAVGQASYAKDLRTSGLAHRYYGLQNQQAGAELGANALGTAKEMTGYRSQATGFTKQSYDAGKDALQSYSDALFGTFGAVRDAQNRNAPTDRPSNTNPQSPTGGRPSTGLANRSLDNAAPPGSRRAEPSASEINPQGGERMGGGRFTMDPSEGTIGAAGETTPVQPAPVGGGGSPTPVGGANGRTRTPSNWGDAALRSAQYGANAAMTGAKTAYANEIFGKLQGFNVQQAQMGMGQFGQGMTAKGLGMHAGRVQAGADFQANMARWNAQTDYALGVGDNLSARGVMAGAFDPGPKPAQMDGMAMSGMLNSQSHGDARKKANFFNNDPSYTGGWFSQLSAKEAGIRRSVGPQVIANDYKQWGVGGVAGYTAKTTVDTGVGLVGAVSKTAGGKSFGNTTFWTGRSGQEVLDKGSR